MLCKATQDGWVIVESSDKTWSTEEGNEKLLQCSCLENPKNHIKRQKDMTLKDEFPRSVSVYYAMGEEWKNTSKENEEAEPKQKQCPVLDVTGDGSKVQCCKEQYCIGTWNVRSMNQGKLEVVKQETARVNIDILGISELKWTAAAAAAAAKSRQSCPTLCDPIDGSPPGSSVPGILQARTLAWVAISFSNA